MQVIKIDFKDFCERSGADVGPILSVRNNLSTDGVWLGGGAIRRTISKRPLDSDFDFFFRDKESFDKWVASMPSTMLKTKETQHHVQFDGTMGESKLPITVQGIFFKFYTDPEDVIDSFDYTLTMFCLEGGVLTTTVESLWDTANKRLAINKITYPVATMRRLLKYTNQGYTACSGCLASIIKETVNSPGALGELDIAYVD